jgi:hypothetical protein
MRRVNQSYRTTRPVAGFCVVVAGRMYRPGDGGAPTVAPAADASNWRSSRPLAKTTSFVDAALLIHFARPRAMTTHRSSLSSLVSSATSSAAPGLWQRCIRARVFSSRTSLRTLRLTLPSASHVTTQTSSCAPLCASWKTFSGSGSSLRHVGCAMCAASSAATSELAVSPSWRTTSDMWPRRTTPYRSVQAPWRPRRRRRKVRVCHTHSGFRLPGVLLRLYRYLATRTARSI